MTLDRHLARLLAVVIVMIAASFGVSAVQAHDGHVHHQTTQPVVETAQPFTEAATVERALVSAEAVTAARTIIEASVDHARTSLVVAVLNKAGAATDCSGCNGVCCSMGMACCHYALTPAQLAGVPALTLTTTMVAPQDVVRPSMAPEALPRPPRPFA